MKFLMLFLFCFCNIKIKAQTDSITKPILQVEIIPPDKEREIISDYYNSYTRAIIGLKDHSVLRVDQITTHNNDVMVEYNKKKIPLHPLYNIPVENISYVKFKSGSFVKGMLAGAFIGAIIAAVYGKSTNEDAKSIRKSLYVTLGIIPLGLTSGIIGSIFIKKTFIINGNREKMNKVIRRM